MDKKTLEKTLEYVKSLPEGRRFFYNTGTIMVEVSKEEAIQKIKEMLKELEEKEGKND